VLTVFSNLSAIVFLPRLARITDDRLYRNRCLQFGAVLAAIATTLWLIASAVPHLLLAVLGQHYRGLDGELGLTVAGSGLSLVGGYLVNVNLARSWNRWQGAAVLVLASAQAVMVALLPLGTTRGVLVFNLLGGVVGLCSQAAITTVGFLRPSWVHWE
jgi:hypothetical protein